TREVTVGVWVGNFDRAELRSSSGVTGAAPIFHDVLLAAEQRVMGRLPGPDDPPLGAAPPGLVPRSICALSGREATELCPAVETGGPPGAGALGSCLGPRRRAGRVVIAWPPRYRSWAREHGLLDTAAIAETRPQGAPPARAAASVRDSLRIVSPPAGATYLR